MVLLALIGIVPTCIIAGLWIYARWYYGSLEKKGIPVVPYTNPILGSLKELHENVGGLQDVQWMRKYGKVFGVYEGRSPMVYVCDPNLVRLICVKDADHFNGKTPIPAGIGDPILSEMPDTLPLEKWKLVRSMTTPAFSSAKVKIMHLPMSAATSDFILEIKENIAKSGKGIYEKFAIDQAIHTMLTDLISRTFFSVQISDPNNPDNEFVTILKEVLTPLAPSWSQHLEIYMNSFPFLRKFIRSQTFGKDPVNKFVKIFKQMMDERRKSGQRRNDVVDMYLDWYDKLDSPEFKQVRITEMTLLCQVFVFFISSQDQLSTMIAGVIYHMTQDPDLERKIYAEVDRTFAENNGKIEHEHLPQLTVLNACISECLRLYTVFNRTDRICTKDWRNEEYNLEFKVGDKVIIPLWALNRNEEFHENPDEFNYERFMPENKGRLNQFASVGFGFGPRNCTGKRWSMEAMPLILAYLLKDLQFIGREDTAMTFLRSGPGFTIHEAIYVDVKLREK